MEHRTRLVMLAALLSTCLTVTNAAAHDGSVSLGRPNAGALVNGVAMPSGDHWTVVDQQRAWGTSETVASLVEAIVAVNESDDECHKLFIGHLSRRGGGRLWPHKSHQSGRDVDVSYFYKKHLLAGWYQRANEASLDAGRTWRFIKALIDTGNIEYIFISTPLQRLLRRHAIASGETVAFVDRVFEYRSRHAAPLVRHAWGHETHMHIRFRNPEAQTRGSEMYRRLLARGSVGRNGARLISKHRATPTDELAALARDFGTSVRAILHANDMRLPALQPGVVYLVPRRVHLLPALMAVSHSRTN